MRPDTVATVPFVLNSPTTITSLILSFQAFDVVKVMTQGGPGDATNIYVYWVYEQAIEFRNWGYSAAAITLFFVVLAGLTIAQYRVMGRRNATGEEI